jgi:hypothetical protein
VSAGLRDVLGMTQWRKEHPKAHGMRNELVEELIFSSASESWTGLGIECGGGDRNPERDHEKGRTGEERRRSWERRPEGSARSSRAVQ